MKTYPLIALLTVLTISLLAPSLRADDITATGSGNWSSTTPDAPWPNGIVPGTNDSVDIESPFVVTVDTNVDCGYIYGGGSVVMAANSVLVIHGDSAGGQGTQSLGLLDASAVGNTVVYLGNPFWCKHQNYYNLVLGGVGDFYNGDIGTPGDNAVAMTIAGNMIATNGVKVQQGDDITINGNLTLGHGCKWDSSSYNLTVASNLYDAGLLLDLDGANGANSFGNVLVATNGIWNVSDVIYWSMSGSLTNLGLMAGVGYGSISFDGTGTITGVPLTLPTITVNGTYTVGTTITLTTNTPTLNGTLVFDLANPKQIVLPANIGSLYYNSNLMVINSGAAPASGATYQFFNAASFGGAFANTTYPTLPNGLSWEDDLFASGSIMVTGSVVSNGTPSLTAALAGGVLTLSWDSSTYPGFHLVAQTNAPGFGANWYDTGSGTVSPYTATIDPANATVFYRLAQ